MKCRAASAGIFYLFVFVILFLLPSALIASNWRTTPVDAPKQFKNFYGRSIAVDSSGNPHIVYGEDHLYHAYHDGTAWQAETVDNSPGVGQYASIAIYSAGGTDSIHVSYYDAVNKNLKYATRGIGSWSIEAFENNDSMGEYSCIAVDVSGGVHISYYDATNDDLKYATNTSGVWRHETVDSTGNVGQYSAIATDSTGKAHISYYDGTNGKLKYAVGNFGTWSAPENPDPSVNVGKYTSIAMDVADSVHIVYYDAGNRRLKYANGTSGSWTAVETVDTGPNAGAYASITVDGSRTAHVSYYDSANNNLKYAAKAPFGFWTPGNLDAGGNVGKYTSIAINPVDNRLHVSYYDETNQYLRYAVKPSGGSWDTTTLSMAKVDPLGNVGGYTAIAMDASNSTHISYYDFSKKNLKYATNASGNWACSAIDTIGDVGIDTSIVTDTSGNVHISYYDATNRDLKYISNASGAFAGNDEVVDNGAGADVGRHSSLALDASGTFHISYYDATNLQLKYVAGTSGAWSSAVNVDTSGNSVGEYSSLGIDGLGNVHICYFDDTADEVKHAIASFANALLGVWTITTVEAVGADCQDIALSVDSTGNVYVAYFDAAGRLKRATYSSETMLWNTPAIVDESISATFGQNLSNAVRGSAMHIAYNNFFGEDLKYASDGSVSILDSIGSVGRFSSTTIDSRGYPRIAYYDETNGDLKYIHGVPEPGDINGDGAIALSDALLALQLSAATPNLSMVYLAADMDGDDRIGIKDAVSIIRFLAFKHLDEDNDGDGYSENEGDCDDGNATVHPNATEICDGLDNDCDGNLPEEETDSDHDGFRICEGDCNDIDSTIHPGAQEICGDGIDQDCSGSDEPCPYTWYKDADDDGYSDGTAIVQVAQPAGFRLEDDLISTSGDCSDTNDTIHPGAQEICGDGIDQDCNGSDLQCLYDGQWLGVAYSDTVLNNQGLYCGDASVDLTISGNQVSGTAIDTWHETYDVTGQVDDTGIVSGGFAKGSYGTVATFNCNLSNQAAGAGTYQTNDGCLGTFHLAKQTPASGSYNGTWIGIALDQWYPDYCGSGRLQLLISNSQISGTSSDTWGESYQISGTLNANGSFTCQIYYSGSPVGTVSGTRTGQNIGTGSWAVSANNCNGPLLIIRP